MTEPYDELMGPTRQNLRDMLGDDDPSMTENEEVIMEARMTPSRWASYEQDSETLRNETHEANCKAVELATEKIANSPPRDGQQKNTVQVPPDYDSDDGSGEYGWENDEQIRAEALRMLDMADEWHAGPYTVRKTATGGFSSSFTDGTAKKKHVPKALAGLDFTSRSGNRASYISNPRSSWFDRDGEDTGTYKEEDKLVDVEDDVEVKKESKWSSRYSIDHTLLALSSGRAGGAVKEVLDRMDRDSDREFTSASNMYKTSANQTKIFGSGGFGFRDSHIFGKQNVTIKQTNLMDLNSDGKSLPPPEPRAKTWQEQVERKKRQQRRLGLGCIAICAVIALIIGVTVKKGGSSATQASQLGAGGKDRGKPEVVFYATCDTPYNNDEEQKLAADLKALPGDAEFLVHLGNIQNAAVTLCAASQYSKVKDILLQSPVPVFILPGEEDWNDCPNPEKAWQSWESNFGTFESNFKDNFVINRQLRRKENFSFLRNDILFLGLHLVGGYNNSQLEWDARLHDDVNWMESMVTMNRDSFNKVVLFGNARPGPKNQFFFEALSGFLGPYELPVIYIHANSGVGGVMQYKFFDSQSNIEGLQIEDGGEYPPMRISVYDGDSPFVVGLPVQ